MDSSISCKSGTFTLQSDAIPPTRRKRKCSQLETAQKDRKQFLRLEAFFRAILFGGFVLFLGTDSNHLLCDHCCQLLSCDCSIFLLKLMLRKTKPWSKVTLWIRGNAPNPAKLCVIEFINCPYRVGSKVLSQVSDIVDLAHRTPGCSSDFSAWVLLETRTWNTNKDVSHIYVDSITFVENSPYQAFLPSPVCSPAQVYVESRK